MEIGEQHHYPFCEITYRRQTVQAVAGSDAWLQFARESGVWNTVDQVRSLFEAPSSRFNKKWRNN